MTFQCSVGFLINKKAGLSSFATIQILKRKLKILKLGHTGTLDPFATGLLIVLANDATKLSSLFLNQPKTYRGEAQWGKKTITGDKNGVLIAEQIPNKMTAAAWLKALKNGLSVLINNPYFQKPPLFSAVKIKGKKLYEYARQKQNPVIKAQERFIYQAVLTKANFNSKQFWFQVTCSKGMYVRTFVEDWAALAQGIAYTNHLQRIAIGSLKLSSAQTTDKVTLESGFDIITLLLMLDFPVYQFFNDLDRYLRFEIPIVCNPKTNDVFFYNRDTAKLYWFQARLNRFYEYKAIIKNVISDVKLDIFVAS